MKLPDDIDEIIESMNLEFTPVDLQKADALDIYRADRYGVFYAVGGGKTLVSTIASMLWDESHTLIIGPPILSPQWEAWLHSIGQKDTSIYATPKRHNAMLKHRWVIMSHNIFRDSFTDILATFKGKDVNLIIDEAHAIKNPKSMLYRKVNQFLGADRRVQMLTATPTTKPQDTYTYMKVKTPQVYRSYGHWENLHVGDRDFFGTITSYRNLNLLADNFAMKTVTRTKKDLFGDTLTPIWQPIPYDLSAKHLRLYNKLAEEQLLLLDNGSKIDGTSKQRLRHLLQQIVLNYAAFSGNEKDIAAGIELLDSVIEQVDPMTQGHSKLAIWTYYKSTSRFVTKYLEDKFGTEAVAPAYGGVNSAEGVRRIMFEDRCRFLVAQPTSVGAGLNLQHVCSEMLFLEQSTTPMHTIQAAGRVDRPGQKVRPTIRFAQAKGTVQIAMFRDLLENDDLVKQVERKPKSLREEIFGQ